MMDLAHIMIGALFGALVGYRAAAKQCALELHEAHGSAAEAWQEAQDYAKRWGDVSLDRQRIRTANLALAEEIAQLHQQQQPQQEGTES